MIIQTGNRTDIPAFYTQWFTNRLREGFRVLCCAMGIGTCSTNIISIGL